MSKWFKVNFTREMALSLNDLNVLASLTLLVVEGLNMISTYALAWLTAALVASTALVMIRMLPPECNREQR